MTTAATMTNWVTILVSAIGLAATATANDLVGRWEFENSANLGQASLGADMTSFGPVGTTAGINGSDGAAEVPVNSYLRATNTIGPNGAGFMYTNEYTLVLDIKIPTLANWIAIAELDSLSTGDGDYFYSDSRGLGVNSEGYVDDGDPPTSVLANTWHRLVLAMDNGNVRETFVDGVRQLDPSGTFGHFPGTADGRWCLRGTFDLFSDNGGGEEAVIHVTQVALYDGRLTDMEIMGMGDVHGALVTSGIGTNYCSAAGNSTGATATMSAAGSASVTQNNLTLEASNLPTNAFGFFLTSMTQGFVTSPGGSQGNLCLGGSIGRYVGAGQIQNSGSSGSISLGVDLTQHPTPNGLVAVQVGETWNFTAWFRDSVGGMATSNFADGLEVTFN